MKRMVKTMDDFNPIDDINTGCVMLDAILFAVIAILFAVILIGTAMAIIMVPFLLIQALMSLFGGG